MRPVICIILCLISIPSAYADLGIKGTTLSPEMKSRIATAQKDFIARITAARKSGNIQQVKYLFNLDGVDNAGVREMDIFFGAILNSTKPFSFKELPAKYDGTSRYDGKRYKTTLPINTLIGIAELKLQKDNAKMQITFPVGEDNGKLYFSPYLIPVSNK